MKKAFILLLIPFFAISCSNYGDETRIKTVNLVVEEYDWVEYTNLDGTNRYYSCSFTMPEITSDVYEYGSLQTYYMFGSAQLALPYVQHKENIGGAMWTQTVDCDYSVGSMSIRVTNSDFFKKLPGKMTFRVVMMWPD